MSWNLSARGQIKTVKKVIDEQAHARYDPIPADENTQQKRIVAALLLAQIDCLKVPNGEYNGVRVEASGHLHGGWGSLKIELSMDRFLIDEPVVPLAPNVEKGWITDGIVESVKISTPSDPAITAAPPVTELEAKPAAESPCPDCGNTGEHTRGCAQYK